MNAKQDNQDSYPYINQIPDLESLDTVEKSAKAIYPIMSALLIAASLLLYTTIKFKAYLTPLDGRLLAGLWTGIAIELLIMAYCVYSMLFRFSYVKSNPEGIYLKSLLTRKFITWKNLEKNHLTLTIFDDIQLRVSIWQHLRRLGKGELFKLPKKALSFWDDIPSIKPLVTDWRNSRLWQVLNVSLIVISIALTCTLFIIKPFFSTFIFTLISYILCYNSILLTKRVSLTNNQLTHSNYIKTVYLERNDILNASSNELGYIYLLTTKGFIPLKFNLNDEIAAKLFLAITRWLREGENPIHIAIPEALRTPLININQNYETTTKPITFSINDYYKALVIIAVLILSILSFSFILNKGHNITLLSFLLLILSGSLIYLTIKSYTFHFDDNGIKIHNIISKRSISWNEVNGFKTIITGSFSTFILIGKNNKPLLSYLDEKNTVKRGIFMRYLLHNIPTDRIIQPWLSLPWKAKKTQSD